MAALPPPQITLYAVEGRVELESTELARKIVDLIVDKKGSDVLLLDLRPISLIADYFVIASGETERQIGAIVEGINEELGKQGIHPLHMEGVPASGWVLMDYGGVVVHIFAPLKREYYRIERLWKEAPVVVWIQ